MVYAELLSFVKSDQDNVREQAVDLILAMSASPLESDFEILAEDYLRALWRLATRPSQKGSKAALSALVNLADRYERTMCNESWIGAICEEIEERHTCGPREFETLLFMLLSNITRTEDAVATILKRELFLWRIFSYLVDTKPDLGAQEQEPGTYICNVFINITGTEQGRKWFATMDHGFWSILFDQCKIPSRAILILSVLKNLCCDLELLETIYDDVDIQKLLLIYGKLVYPNRTALKKLQTSLTDSRPVHIEIETEAVGPQADVWCRKLIIEAIVSLFRVRKCREIARELCFYDVIRMWHMQETNEHILQAIEDNIHLIHYSEQELEEQDNLSHSI